MEIVSLLEHGHLWSFLVLVIGIIALPGADMAFVTGNTLVGGRSSGVAAISGIVAGGITHSLMAYFGIGIVLQAIPWAFPVMLVVGATYLAWLGVQFIVSAPASNMPTPGAARPRLQTMAQGMTVSLLNPKAYFFMLAIYPQFIIPNAGSLALQIFILGAIIAAVQIIVYGCTAWSVVKISGSSANGRTLQNQLSRALGILLIGFAIFSVARAFLGN